MMWNALRSALLSPAKKLPRNKVQWFITQNSHLISRAPFANAPRERSCEQRDGGRCSIHTTNKDSAFHKGSDRCIVCVAKLLELAGWCRQRQECSSGGEPCPKARKTVSP